MTNEELRLSAMQIATQPQMMSWDQDPTLALDRARQIYAFLSGHEPTETKRAPTKEKKPARRRYKGYLTR